MLSALIAAGALVAACADELNPGVEPTNPALVALKSDTEARRRLGGPGALPNHALLPEHERKWVHPAGLLATPIPLTSFFSF